MEINEERIERICESAVTGIESDINNRHAVLLWWALIEPEVRERILGEWKKIISAAIAGDLRNPATVRSGN